MTNVMEFTFPVYKMVGGWWTVKFSFSEKATKICTILHMVLTFTQETSKPKLVQIFVAFSEKLNFTGKALAIVATLKQKCDKICIQGHITCFIN